MKISQTPTSTLLVKAGVNSEFDSVQFILLNVTDYLKDVLKIRLDIMKYLKGKPGCEDIYTMSFWDSPDGWYTTHNDFDLDDELQDMLDGIRTGWAWVEVEKDYIMGLDGPENTLDIPLMKVNSDGDFWFSALGKHTGYEFWTEHVKIKDIV